MQLIFFILAILVACELGLHIVYHAMTGKAGLTDAPFDYLKDLLDGIRRRRK